MRTKILILILLVCGITRAAAVNYDADGHILTREWALYREAKEQDRPKDALEVLERIISVAQKERYALDFLDGWNARVSTASSRDWRQRDSLRRECDKAIEEYDEPILTYVAERFEYKDLPIYRERLKKGRNRGFYHKLQFISNDYEYVLWLMLMYHPDSMSHTGSELYDECRQVFGPALELLREDHMLSRRLESLYETCNGGDDTPARTLYADCKDLERRISALKGANRQLASTYESYKSVAQSLTENSVRLDDMGDSILVIFHNQRSTTLSIVKERKTLRKWTVQKPGNRFYLADTAKIAIPAINDGEYEIHYNSDGEYKKAFLYFYSLSLYCQKGPEYFHYVADAVTGRPVENYVLSWSKDSLRVSASSQGRLSDTLRIGRRPRPLRTTYMYEDFIKAEMFTDKKAYRRGESVEVKALLYKGSTTATAHIMPEGTEVQFVFRDREGKLLKECGTALSKAGTACASFALPDDIRGGYLSIDVNVDGNLCGSDYVQVDDFVLAEFNCEFDQIRELYFPGDTVTVTGRVYAMDGGRADVVSATYSTASDSRSSSETRPLDVARDGSFSIRVPDTGQKRWRSSSVTVRFRLSSGETREFNKVIFYSDRCGLTVEPTAVQRYNSFYCYSSDEAALALSMTNADGCPQSVEVSYSLAKDGAAVCEGTAITGKELTVPLNKGEGNYRLTLIPQCRNCDTTIVDIVRYTPGASSLDADVENMFLPVDGEGICFDFGSTRGPVWAVALVMDDDGRILARRDIFLEGRRACEGSFKRITIPYETAFPDNVAMKLFYFKNNTYYEFEHQFNRPTGTGTLDIRWNRMDDSTTVGAEYTVSFNAPGSLEAAVSVFDRSTEFIAENRWSQIPLADGSAYHPYGWAMCGNKRVMDNYGAWMYNYVQEEAAIPFQLKSGRAAANGMPDSSEAGPRLRSDFATTLCWAPRLEPDENGRYSVKFRTSDKTGTFVVNAFAHDASVRSAADRRTFTVSLPVKVDVLRPTVLTAGDRYDLRAVVSSLRINNIGINVKGLVKISSDACDIAGEMPVSVATDSSAVAVFPIEVPAGITELPLTVTVLAEDGRYSDAIALSIPVRPAVQRLTEAHSAVLRHGDRGDAVLDSLRSAFINTSSYGAEYKEIAIRDMLAQCIAGKHDSALNGAKHGNAISLSAAICTELVYASMDGSAVKDTTGLRETLAAAAGELASFQYSDGGLAWIKGMRSNAIVTCAVLERLALTRNALGLFDRSFAERAMAYLDRCAVAQSVNTGQYLYVRSLYADIPFAAKADKKFSKRVRDFLLPKNERGLGGMIYDKMLRINTLAALKGGSDLLGAWGVNCTDRDLDKSIQADVLSLSQYAVSAGHGAVFYPNLVMPYRGLLASEAYAHTLLCRALQPWRPDLSDGIRLWLMLQKETQHWDSGFEFVNVVSELLGAGDAVLDTRIATLSQSYEKPISEIKAAGNGMTLKCSYERKADGKMIATYRISSENNRSFVCLTVPRFGCLMPADQISHFTRYGVYREVLHDRTLYWFEVLPEHVTTITEEFFVTQNGSFNAPVPTIECLYAPHYFANTQYIIL